MYKRRKKKEDIDLEIDEEIEDTEEDNDDFLDDELNDSFDDFGSWDNRENASSKHKELLQQLMNFAPYLEDKMKKWLGIAWDEKSKEYKQVFQPIINEHGARWIVSFLSTYVRDNNIVTHISQQDYNYMVLDIIKTTYYNIGTRYEEFGIKRLGDVGRICREVIDSAKLILMGSGDGKASKILTDTTQRNENVQINDRERPNLQRPVKRGLINKFRTFIGGD